MDTIKEIEALDPTSATSNANKFDILTPHKIAVVLLVQQYLVAKKNADDNSIMYPAQARRKFCMLLLKLIQYPDLSYEDLHNLLTSSKYKIEEMHLNEFETCMSSLIELGIENLFDLFDLQNVMAKLLSENSGVSQFGIVGLYIRRVVITMDRMTFPEMMALYKHVTSYYKTGVNALKSSSGTSSSAILTDSMMTTQLIDKDRNSYTKWSAKQAELFVAQQCSLLELNEVRALPPSELQTKLNEIITDNPLNSQAHFLSFLNNLRLRDFFNSLDAVHRAFDRSPVQSFNPPETRGFQYSTLNLAIMHAHFNHKKEALTSLKESIMLAQECGDYHCLELANAWLCILNSDKVKPGDKCIPDQSDPGKVEAVSLSIQFVVKIAALCGYKPRDLFELLLKSDEVNCRNSIMELVANSLAQRCALWTLYGKNEISSLSAQLLLKLNRSWAYGEVGNNEGVCQVLCCLALWLSIQGEFALCAVVLNHARERFPRDPFARNWMICDCYVTINQAIYKCKWQEGQKACCQLYILDEKASILQRAALCIARRNLVTARKLIDSLLGSNNLSSMLYVRALILLAYTMITPDGLSAEVIQVLNTAAVYAKEKYLEYEEAIINMMTAYVLLGMNLPQQALKTIKSCIETILANGGIYDQAKAIFVFIRCLVASATNKDEKIKRMSDSAEMVQRAIEYFKKIEAHSKVKDMYIFLAKFYNDVQLDTERNNYACKFKHYAEEFPTASEYLSCFF